MNVARIQAFPLNKINSSDETRKAPLYTTVRCNRLKKVTSQLSQSLKNHLKWSKGRADCFIQLLIGLLTVYTVNLTVIVLCFHQQQRQTQIIGLFSAFLSQIRKYISLLTELTGFAVRLKSMSLWVLLLTKALLFRFYESCLPKRVLRAPTKKMNKLTLLQRFIHCFRTYCLQALLADREFRQYQTFYLAQSTEYPLLYTSFALI